MHKWLELFHIYNFKYIYHKFTMSMSSANDLKKKYTNKIKIKPA
jgi:hypothetical protein